jgi:hypothetical protein
MNAKWLYWVRRIHLISGVFFAPLLVLFILTGCWQTLASDEEKERTGGWLQSLVVRLSTVHTDSYFPPEHHGAHAHLPFKVLVVGMCAGLLISVVLGLVLAAKLVRERWLVAAVLLLGIAVPVLLLWVG